MPELKFQIFGAELAPGLPKATELRQSLGRTPDFSGVLVVLGVGTEAEISDFRSRTCSGITQGYGAPAKFGANCGLQQSFGSVYKSVLELRCQIFGAELRWVSLASKLALSSKNSSAGAEIPDFRSRTLWDQSSSVVGFKPNWLRISGLISCSIEFNH